jgi:regulatory protein YycH of two-component signal transduction system YycFG
MATATYERIATQTLVSAAATITFSSIAATYTDLRMVLVGTCTSTATFANCIFNSVSTGSLYSNTALYGDGTSALSAANTSANSYYLGQTSQVQTSTPTSLMLDIFSYAGSTNKTALFTGSFDQNGSGAVERNVGLFRSTTAISSITMRVGSVNWAIGTIATLYGIKAA